MKRTDEQLQELLLRELSGAGKLRRKQLIEAGIAALGMEAGSDADLTPGAPLTMMKSRLGMVLTGLIHAGSIREDEAGFLHLERAQDIEFAPAAIRAFITRTIGERRVIGKQLQKSQKKAHVYASSPCTQRLFPCALKTARMVFMTNCFVSSSGSVMSSQFSQLS